MKDTATQIEEALEELGEATEAQLSSRLGVRWAALNNGLKNLLREHRIVSRESDHGLVWSLR